MTINNSDLYRSNTDLMEEARLKALKDKAESSSYFNSNNPYSTSQAPSKDQYSKMAENNTLAPAKELESPLTNASAIGSQALSNPTKTTQKDINTVSSMKDEESAGFDWGAFAETVSKRPKQDYSMPRAVSYGDIAEGVDDRSMVDMDARKKAIMNLLGR